MANNVDKRLIMINNAVSLCNGQIDQQNIKYTSIPHDINILPTQPYITQEWVEDQQEVINELHNSCVVTVDSINSFNLSHILRLLYDNIIAVLDNSKMMPNGQYLRAKRHVTVVGPTKQDAKEPFERMPITIGILPVTLYLVENRRHGTVSVSLKVNVVFSHLNVDYCKNGSEINIED